MLQTKGLLQTKYSNDCVNLSRFLSVRKNKGRNFVSSLLTDLINADTDLSLLLIAPLVSCSSSK